jgi:hypothetical protein
MTRYADDNRSPWLLTQRLATRQEISLLWRISPLASARLLGNSRQTVAQEASPGKDRPRTHDAGCLHGCPRVSTFKLLPHRTHNEVNHHLPVEEKMEPAVCRSRAHAISLWIVPPTCRSLTLRDEGDRCSQNYTRWRVCRLPPVVPSSRRCRLLATSAPVERSAFMECSDGKVLAPVRYKHSLPHRCRNSVPMYRFLSQCCLRH